MQITIVFATYSNSTAIASQHLFNSFQSAGHTPLLVEAAQATVETLESPDILIFASPSWDYNGQQGMPHEDFTALQERLAQTKLDGKPTAVLALGDSSFTYFCGAAGHLTAWLKDKGGAEIIPALKIDQFYANEVAAQQQIDDWSKEILAKTAAH